MCSLHLFTLAAIGVGEASSGPGEPRRRAMSGGSCLHVPGIPRGAGQAENRAGASAVATPRPTVQTSSLGNDPSGERLSGKG